jgi:hypothetical protein
VNQSALNIQGLHALQENFIAHHLNFAQNLTLINQNFRTTNDKIFEANKNKLILNSFMNEIKSS